MNIKIPAEGISVKNLCQLHPAQDRDSTLEMVACLVRSGEAHLQGDLIFPGKRKPGRPLADNPRVPVTIRLPADMVRWLKSQKNYTLIIEESLRKRFDESVARRRTDEILNTTRALFEK